VQLPGPGDQQGFAITVSDNAVWVGGGFDQPITLGADTLTPVDDFDIFIAKLNTADGAISASHAIGGTGKQQVNAMTTTIDGAVVLTGTSEIETDTSAALVAQLASDATVAWSLDLGVALPWRRGCARRGLVDGRRGTLSVPSDPGLTLIPER